MTSSSPTSRTAGACARGVRHYMPALAGCWTPLLPHPAATLHAGNHAHVIATYAIAGYGYTDEVLYDTWDYLGPESRLSGCRCRLLTPDHGFPVRLIIPGHIGGRMVKWLEVRSLRVLSTFVRPASWSPQQ